MRKLVVNKLGSCLDFSQVRRLPLPVWIQPSERTRLTGPRRPASRRIIVDWRSGAGLDAV